jgi:hypothetical protein
MDETREKILRDLKEARVRVSGAERRLLELMMHRIILERLGRDTSASKRSGENLEQDLVRLHAELEFAGHREMFTRPRAGRLAPREAANTN